MIIRGNTVGTNMSVDRIAEKIGGTGGVAPLIVTVDGETFKASHTPLQVYDYATKHGEVFLVTDGIYHPFSDLSFTKESVDGELISETHIASFTTPISMRDGKCCLDFINIDDSCNITSISQQLATAEDIGNISSALDELHDYAQGLIKGGGSV